MEDKVKVGRFTVRIEQDPDPPTPREYDNLGTMICFNRRYTLGDKHEYKTPDDFLLALAGAHFKDLSEYLENKVWRSIVKANYDEPGYIAQTGTYNARRKDIIWDTIHKHYLILPLGLIDHSGISMYIGSGAHSCDPGGWDSGQIGWVYVSKRKIRSEGYGKYLTKKVLAKAEEVLRGEVETYDQYLTGDVWGYIVEDEDGNNLDSCWGFFGSEYAMEEGKTAAEYHVKQDAKIEHMERNCYAL